MEASGHSDSRTRFAQTSVLADAACAAQLRQEFCVWLKRYFALDPTKVSDVVLAVNEALANAAEFAYSTADRPGAMHLLADYDTGTAELTVTVSDEGAWRIANGENKKISRGRGIPLMQALADRATIDSTPTGTRVRMVWNHVAAAQGAIT
ncbi:MAG TPA: ATP-binding protein [Mycobacterium sp.]|jgi:anti-sigma regulatory factor (Ser/Thr protein kinase)|nr:ATP-binding protein [Mycobacterium sp.]